MFIIRRAAAQSLQSFAARAVVPRSISRAHVVISSKPAHVRCFSQIRPRLSDGKSIEEPIKEQADAEELEEVREQDVLDQAQDIVSSQSEASTSSQASAATSESTDELSSQDRPTTLSNDSFGADQAIAATSESTDAVRRPYRNEFTIYCQNVPWGTTSEQLREHFSRCGEVFRASLPTNEDGGLRGIGFVQFTNNEAYQTAIRELNGVDFFGRPLLVKPSLSTGPRASDSLRPRRDRTPNPPSRTVFIGNMDFKMTDGDLNDLFREVKGVTAVRVAMDRRSGQPRGFAHADFVDIDTAQAAKDFLATKSFYGRRLLTDFQGAVHMKSS